MSETASVDVIVEAIERADTTGQWSQAIEWIRQTVLAQDAELARVRAERDEARADFAHEEGYHAVEELQAELAAMTDAESVASGKWLDAMDEMANMVPATFAGLLTILDAHYPPDVFTASSEDVGVRLVALARVIVELRTSQNRLIEAGDALKGSWWPGDDTEAAWDAAVEAAKS